MGNRLVVVCGLVGALAAASVEAVDVIENFTATNVALGADATYAGTLRADWAADGVDKSGAGTWTLPVDSADVRADLPVALRAGRLSVTTGGTRAARTKPTAVLAKAAFWLDGSTQTHLAFDTDGTGVTAWYDAREEKLADGTWSNGYCRAVSGATIKSNNTLVAAAYPTHVAAPTGSSQPMLYFNGYPRGSWMRFKSASNGDKDFTTIRHVFFVANIQKTWGFMLSTMSGSVYLHPDGTGNYSAGRTMRYIAAQSASPAQARSTFFLDGLETNPFLTRVKTGAHLMEWKAGAVNGSSLGSFANDRNVSDRFGCDYIGELLIFNVNLSTEERLAVEDYLLDKWGIAETAGRLAVTGAAGTEVSVAEEAADRVALNGAETLVKTGTGTARFRPQAGETATGGLRVEGGTLQAEVGELAYVFRPGETVAAARDSFGVLPVSASTDAADAAAGAAAQTGADATVRVGDQTNALRRLTLAAKDVILGTHAASDALRAGAPVYATIAGGNGSFESSSIWNQNGGQKESGGWTSDTGTTGWVVTLSPSNDLGYGSDGTPKTGGSAWWYGFNSTSAYATYDYTRWFAPDGAKVLVFKIWGSVSASVEVPVAGDYELSCSLSARIGYGEGTMLFALVDAAGTTNYVARFIGPATPIGFTTQRYRVPNLAVGTYTLVVRMDSTGTSDRHVMVDDFKMRLLDSSSDGAVPVPNGDFEDTQFSFASRSTLSQANNTVRGWTLTPGAWGSTLTTGVGTGAEITVTAPEIANGYNEQGVRWGRHALYIQGDEARATTAAFSLPAGCWRLRCKASRWGFTDQGLLTWNGFKYLISAPKVGVRVSVNGVQRFDALSDGVTSHRFATCLFTNVLDVAATDSIVLEVRQAVAHDEKYFGLIQVDDFEFVPMANGQELVQNGSFESDGTYSGTGWTLIYNNDAAKDNLTKSAARWQAFDVNYGHAKGVGEQALILTQIGEARQTVDFPEAGTYELSFWVRSRYEEPNFNLWWGWNAVEGSIIDGAATNVAVVTPAIGTTNFVRYAGLFTVPSAGARTLRLRGMNDGVNCVTTPSGRGTVNDANVFVDGVSIRRVSAPPPDLDAGLALELTDADAKLRLDFTGTLTLNRLRIAGHALEGTIDASHPSGRVTGLGAIFVQPKGTLLLLR